MCSDVDLIVTLILEFDLMWSWEVNFAPLRFTTGGRIPDIYETGHWVTAVSV
jgi:hypothetical protein